MSHASEKNRFNNCDMRECVQKEVYSCVNLTDRLNENVAPSFPPPLFLWLKLLFLAHILPPCASTILLEMNRPKPVPFSDLVANFVNNLGIIDGSIPGPTPLLSRSIYICFICSFNNKIEGP